MADASFAGERRDRAAWNSALTEQREKQAAGMNRWVSAWTWTLLLLLMLYLLIGNTPYQHEPVFDPKTGGAVMSPVNRFIWLALLAYALPVLWWRREGLLDALKRSAPLLILMFWFTATTRWALDPAASDRRLYLYAVDIVVCLAISLGLKDPRAIHSALATACAIVIAIDLGGWIVAPKASMTDLGLAGIHSHKNTLGAAMLLSCVVCGSFIFSQRTWRGRAFWSAVTLAGMVLLIASLSKTSMGIMAGTLVVGPPLLVLLGARGDMRLGVTLAIMTLLASLVLAWLGWNAVTGGDPLAPIEQLTFTGRTDVWQFTISQFLQHPWGGVGFGSFWDVDPAVQPSLQTDYWFAQPDSPTNETHNGYLDLLVTTGIPGGMAATLLLFRWVGRGLAILRRGLIAPAAAAPNALPYLVYLGLFPLLFLVHNCMESSYFNANTMFGVVILLVGVDIDARFERATQDRGYRGDRLIAGTAAGEKAAPSAQ